MLTNTAQILHMLRFAVRHATKNKGYLFVYECVWWWGGGGGGGGGGLKMEQMLTNSALSYMI